METQARQACQGIGIDCRLIGTIKPKQQDSVQSGSKEIHGVASGVQWQRACWDPEFRSSPRPSFWGLSAEREAVKYMLSRCANSQCGKPFLRLREGKLFLVETDRVAKPGESAAPPFVRARQRPRQVEHYWLCDDCAAEWTLVYERESGVELVSLRRPAVSAAGVSIGGAA